MIEFNVKTNFDGKFILRHQLDSSEPEQEKEIAARLSCLQPNDLGLDLVVDVEQSSGGVLNTARHVSCEPGQCADLGHWSAGAGESVLLIAGATSPLKSYQELKLRLELNYTGQQAP